MALFKKKDKTTKTSDAKLVTFTPQVLSETLKIAEQLMAGNAVLIDFSNTPKTLAIRIVDYVSGMLMATKGDYRKVSSKMFLLALKKEVNDKFQSALDESTRENE